MCLEIGSPSPKQFINAINLLILMRYSHRLIYLFRFRWYISIQSVQRVFNCGPKFAVLWCLCVCDQPCLMSFSNTGIHGQRANDKNYPKHSFFDQNCPYPRAGHYCLPVASYETYIQNSMDNLHLHFPLSFF